MQHSLEGQVAEHSPRHDTTRRHTLSLLVQPEPQQSSPSGKSVTKSIPSPQERPWFSPARSTGHMHQHTLPATSQLWSTSECGVMLFPCYPAPNSLYSNKCCQLYLREIRIYTRGCYSYSCSSHSVKVLFSCCFARFPLFYETGTTQISKSFSKDFSKSVQSFVWGSTTSLLLGKSAPLP